MPKKNPRKTRRKIVNAAWKLFYEQGYDNTTVDDIIKMSGTSKGSFYHYFNGKDGLLSTLSSIFDDKYEELIDTIDATTNRFDVLLQLNFELFKLIENSISVELMSRMYSTQLITTGDKHLLDQNRIYFRLLRRIAQEGQERNEITAEISPSEVSRIYALCERALIYDWCLRGGDYSLSAYSQTMMPVLLFRLKK